MTKREDWHAEQADEYERAAENFDAGYAGQTRSLFALLAVSQRLAELTEELRRQRRYFGPGVG